LVLTIIEGQRIKSGNSVYLHLPSIRTNLDLAKESNWVQNVMPHSQFPKG
jgi:hypothetical protein